MKKIRFFFPFFINVLCLLGGIPLKAQTFTGSNLPILSIQTNGQIILDEPKINALLSIRYKGPGQFNKLTDPPMHYDDHIAIEYRGSSSQDFPKKPFGFETRDEDGENLNVSLIGMPKENDWILNSSYNDKTLIRDALAYILAGTCMPYAPRVRHVEIQLDNQYQGVYLLVEKIKQDEHRVAIDKMGNGDNTGDALTGGYIIKIDKETGSNQAGTWVSSYPPYTGAWQQTLFQIDYPDSKDITNQQQDYIRQHMNTFENVMNSQDYKNPTSGYRQYMDEGSIIDFIIMNELTKNPDAYRLSTFLYKQRDSKGGKFFMGPVWDFNLGFGNVDYCTQGDPYGLVIQQFNQICPQDYWVTHFWWKKFMEDNNLLSSLKNRWQTLRSGQLTIHEIHAKIDSMATLLEDAQKRNFTKWPVLGTYVWPNYYIGATYAQEVSYLKNWIRNRIGYLDGLWGGPVSTESSLTSSWQIYPVPADDIIEIQYEGDVKNDISISLIDVFGASHSLYPVFLATGKIELNIRDCKPGIYILRMKGQGILYDKKIVIQR